MDQREYDENQLVKNDLFAEWLGESRYIAQIVVDASDCLALLASKRTTLEEKMIRQELHALIQKYGDMLAVLHSRLASADVPEVRLLEELRTLNFEARRDMSSFLKALRYNFNYVEQYFEFDFCARLREECHYSEEAGRLVEALKNN